MHRHTVTVKYGLVTLLDLKMCTGAYTSTPAPMDLIRKAMHVCQTTSASRSHALILGPVYGRVSIIPKKIQSICGRWGGVSS